MIFQSDDLDSAGATPTPPAPTVSKSLPDVIAQIQASLAMLPANADSPWVNLDGMPYIHKTDDPKASPWNCAVVGRFDYLQTMDYMLACQPANIRILLAAIAAKEAEVGRLKADAERFRWLAEGKSIHGGWMGSAPFVMSPNRSRLYAIHALRDEALRIEVDVDIYDNKADELHKANELVERGLLPGGVRRDTCDERYIDALYKLARQELGWPDERAKACDAQLDPRGKDAALTQGETK